MREGKGLVLIKTNILVVYGVCGGGCSEGFPLPFNPTYSLPSQGSIIAKI